MSNMFQPDLEYVVQPRNIIQNQRKCNLKVDHKDYQCDHTTWGVGLCEKIGSDHFKLLYDIYHMQVMEGDIIDTIRKNHKYFGKINLEDYIRNFCKKHGKSQKIRDK